jgi:hypothetical protein
MGLERYVLFAGRDPSEQLAGSCEAADAAASDSSWITPRPRWLLPPARL